MEHPTPQPDPYTPTPQPAPEALTTTPPTPPTGQPGGAIKTSPMMSPILLIGVAAVVLILGGIVGLSAIKPKQLMLAPTPTPAQPATPTPTPVRALSSIASQSAFMSYQTSVASLSTAIDAYNPVDQTLTPPVLVLPLGLTQ